MGIYTKQSTADLSCSVYREMRRINKISIFDPRPIFARGLQACRSVQAVRRLSRFASYKYHRENASREILASIGETKVAHSNAYTSSTKMTLLKKQYAAQLC